MNKTELVAKMAEKTGFTKKDTEKFLSTFIETVEETLISGDKVQLVGFGTFEAKDRKAREGRNPQNPEEIIQIAACKAPTFKAGKNFKEVLNQ